MNFTTIKKHTKEYAYLWEARRESIRSNLSEVRK